MINKYEQIKRKKTLIQNSQRFYDCLVPLSLTDTNIHNTYTWNILDVYIQINSIRFRCSKKALFVFFSPSQCWIAIFALFSFFLLFKTRNMKMFPIYFSLVTTVMLTKQKNKCILLTTAIANKMLSEVCLHFILFFSVNVVIKQWMKKKKKKIALNNWYGIFIEGFFIITLVWYIDVGYQSG